MNQPMAVEEVEEVRAQQLPNPTGYHILCAVPQLDEKIEGSVLVRPVQVTAQEQFATVVLFVMKLGPDAYKGAKFSYDQPWCKEGDFIIARQYSGTRLKIHGREFRILNDDQ